MHVGVSVVVFVGVLLEVKSQNSDFHAGGAGEGAKGLTPADAAHASWLADNKTGYFGVCLAKPGRPKPYRAELRRGRVARCCTWEALPPPRRQGGTDALCIA